MILILLIDFARKESYTTTPWYPYFGDYYSGEITSECDNGCCDPVICSLNQKCRWYLLDRQRAYEGYPEQCKDFKECLQTESENTCARKIFNIK